MNEKKPVFPTLQSLKDRSTAEYEAKWFPTWSKAIQVMFPT